MSEQNLLTKLKEVLLEIERLEKKYRKIYNNAVDIDDLDVSQKTQANAYIKIRKFKEWKNILIAVNSNIMEIIPLNDMNDEVVDKSEKNDQVPDKTEIIDTVSQEYSEYKSIERIKIDKYVRSKICELSKSGFIFSATDIKTMQNLSWSKKNLGLDYEFIKVTYMDHEITESMRNELAYNRFGKEVFNFGKIKILVTNQWNEKDRNMFDIWYDKLGKDQYSLNKNYKDNEKSTYELDGYTCKDLISIKLFDKVHPMVCWNEILIKVCEVMILKAPYTIARFGREPTLNSKQRTNFSYKASEIKVNKKKLSNGLWIETNRGANDIVKVSKIILELCGFSEKDLTIHFE